MRCHDDRQPVRWRVPTAADHIASAICPIVAMKGDVVAFRYDPTPERFPPIWGARSGFGDPTGTICTQLQDLQANFANSSTQGTSAYVNQITLDHPEVDPSTAAADAVLAVGTFTDRLLGI